MKKTALVLAAVLGTLLPFALHSSEQERIAQRRAAWKAGHRPVYTDSPWIVVEGEASWWYDEQPCMTRCDWCDETVNEATDRAVKAERELAEARADLARIKADIEGFVTARGLADEFYDYRMAREKLRWASLKGQVKP